LVLFSPESPSNTIDPKQAFITMQAVQQLVNKSLDRSLRIIETLANHNGPMKLQRIAETTAIPESTVLRILSTLVVNGFALQDPDTKRYFLTLKLSYLGSRVSSQLNIRDVVRPFLVELSENCHESACLAIEQDLMAVYIDYVEGPDKLLRTLHHIGRMAPLHCTGVGKTLMINFSAKDLDRYTRIKGLTPLTEHSIKSKDLLIVELATIRRTGWAVDDEECEKGVRCIAAPIKDYMDKVIASISVTGPSSRLTDNRLEEIKQHVTASANQISRHYGGDF
jgi:DNA-binding IclR family transcriptional regulator